MSQSTERVKITQACIHCRKKKVKCDGSVPCGNCMDRGQQCSYPVLRRRGRKTHEERVRHSGANRVEAAQQVEPSDRSGYNMFANITPPSQHSFTFGEGRQVLLPPEIELIGQSQHPPIITAEAGSAESSAASRRLEASAKTQSALLYEINEEDVQGRPLTPRGSEIDREEATMDLQAVNWEHHGPGSWLSICSNPGLQWVCAKVGTTRFNQVAHGLVMDWTSRLTLDRGTLRERSPEPDIQTAWNYTSAYFEKSHDSIFGAICKPDFESRLRSHFQNSSQNDDAAWYALRNAVYGVGCRSFETMDQGRSFEKVQQESLQFFHNAFSVLSDLLYMPNGLMAIQALLVMTSFAELLGSPAVEYMLCSSAARLAQSKGLHRQPSKLWKLPAVEILHRSWVFWAVYCYESYIALRSGRPSTFDDSEISCQVPTRAPEGSTIDIEMFSAIISHARICSGMIQQLFSVEAFNQPPGKLFEIARRLEDKLEEWRKLLPPHLTIPHNTESSASTTSYRQRVNIIRLHYLYWGSVIALHAIFHYPWISPALTRKKPHFDDQISRSSNLAAEASRQILSTLQDTSFDTTFPSPIAFYYPMLAVINLFVYILKNPEVATVQSDIAHLDLAAGHFAKVRFLTSSQVSFEFPREIIGLASKVVRMTSTQSTVDLPPSLPVETSPMDSVLDSIVGLDELNQLSTDLFDYFPESGDMIFF